MVRGERAHVTLMVDDWEASDTLQLAQLLFRKVILGVLENGDCYKTGIKPLDPTAGNYLSFLG